MAWPPPRAYIAGGVIRVERNGMPHKPRPKPDDPTQSRRFIELAHELGAEDDSRSFERAFRKVATAPRTPRPTKKKRR
jgi:hypothetical protein